MTRLSLLPNIALASLLLCPGPPAQGRDKAATVHLRIVNITGDDLGMATVKVFEREYGELPSRNLAERFQRNTAFDIPYDFYRLCAYTAGFWTACTEVPVYQPDVLVVVGLRIGMAGWTEISKLAGMVKNRPSGETPIWLRLIGVYSGVTVDARTDSSGHFLMSGIPTGNSVLLTIQGKMVLDTRSIEIPTSRAIEIDLRVHK